MMTYNTAKPRIGTVAPARKQGLIAKAMRAPVKPVQPKGPRY